MEGMKKMQTTLSRRGQTVVPAAIRKRHHLFDGDRLAWIDDGETIKIIPIPADPVRALKGIAKGERLVQELMKYRKEERARER
jgi:AbrB family looped-hinge helix DNA binding protein